MDTAQWVAVIALILSTLLNAAYFVPIIYAAYFKPEKATSLDHAHGEPEPHGEAALPILIPLLVTAAMTVFIFFNHELPLALAKLMLEVAP